MTYKCLKSDFEELTKKINRITKKLNKNNLKWHFEKLGESVEETCIIDYTNYDNIPKSQFIPTTKKIIVDVISYDFEMESLKLGEYTPIAVLEHNAIIGQKENIIHKIIEGVEIPAKYRATKSICEHCNSNRMRNKTVLLQDAQGNIKQVGTTCIKEYTGIDGNDIIEAYKDIQNIIINNNYLYVDNEQLYKYPKYANTIDYLSNCIELIKTKGYNKNDTKIDAWNNIVIDQYVTKNEEYKELAKQIIEYFMAHNFENDFMHNIKIYLSNDYTKQSGFVAYAYIAYEKEIEYQNRQKKENAISEYVGGIGQKIQTELTLKNIHFYETSYNGYDTTIQNIFIFEDKDGNIYKWNTSNGLNDKKGNSINKGDKLTLKGTIKEHTEYNGQKQTVLTRCKVIEG